MAENKFNPSGSKYLRSIQTVDSRVDVYAVIEAFAVTCPARQHAVKKLLCAGIRGKGGEAQDLAEARDAVDRAIQMQAGRDSPPIQPPRRDCHVYGGRCECRVGFCRAATAS